MKRHKLPFSALRAFEAASRHASLSAAAKELCVTHSAVSHQIKRLEAELGVSLFQRSNRGLKISAEGLALLPILTDSFDRISNALDGLRHVATKQALQVSCTPSFATKWLVPRLADWYARPDSKRVHLVPTLDLLDLKAESIDLAIRCGLPPWQQLQHELLLPIHLVAVCSPEYAANRQLPASASEIPGNNLIHADVGDHGLGEEWRQWLTGCGVECPENLPGLSFKDPALAMQAAADGLGLAIGYLELIDRDLAAGKLILACSESVAHPYSYYLVSDSDARPEPLQEEFREWIFAQLQTSAEAT